MSRHLLVDRPDFQLVVGFDHMLWSFFGQWFNPSRDPDRAVRGWPTRSGLGTRRPADCFEKADEDLGLLKGWARNQLSTPDLEREDTREHFRVIFQILYVEWKEGSDADTRPVPACLQGQRS